MTFQEWSTALTDEFKTAGFDVSDYQGFPLVKMPESHEERVRFLKFQPSMSCQKRIYAEGCLLLPPGA